MEAPRISYFSFSPAWAPCEALLLRRVQPLRRPQAGLGAPLAGRTLGSHRAGVPGLDNTLLVADTSYMGRTKRSVEVAYLDPDKHALLKRLAAGTRIPKTVLVREAIDDLLVKYGVLKTPKRKFPSPDSTETR